MTENRLAGLSPNGMTDDEIRAQIERMVDGFQVALEKLQQEHGVRVVPKCRVEPVGNDGTRYQTTLYLDYAVLRGRLGSGPAIQENATV